MNRLVADIYNFLMPRFCCMCDRRLAPSEKHFCVGCVRQLNRIQYEGEDNHGVIERLFWGQIPIVRATAMFMYEGEKTRQIIHKIKYFDNPEIATFLARVFARENAASDFFQGVDAIVPLPLSWWREHRRGYNQCDFIASGLGLETGIPVIRNAVKRTVDNPTQTHLSHEQRKENVKDIFKLVRPDLMKGKHLLIVDDVITTGSTLLSFASEISDNIDVKISVFSLAYAGQMIRTGLPGEIDLSKTVVVHVRPDNRETVVMP